MSLRNLFHIRKDLSKEKKDVWYYLDLLNITRQKVYIEKIKYRDKRKERASVLTEKNVKKSINEAILTDTKSISDFIDILPAGAPEGELINKYVHQNYDSDLRISSSMERSETIRIFNKYRVLNSDRKRLIASILNIKMDLG